MSPSGPSLGAVKGAGVRYGVTEQIVQVDEITRWRGSQTGGMARRVHRGGGLDVG